MPGGASGSRLERVELRDRRVVIVKWMRPKADWQMRATRDPGVRDAHVYRSGMLAKLPPPVTHAVLDVVDEEGAVGIVMRDVSAGLPPQGRHVSRASTRQLIEATTVMHQHMRDVADVGLCTPEDRYLLLSPQVVATGRDDPSPIPQFALAGWERFFELVPDHLGDSVRRLHDDVRPLTMRLEQYPTTIIHGDLHTGNVALFRDEIVLLDWGLLTTRAPASVEFAYYLAMRDHHASTELTRDELVDVWTTVTQTDPGELSLSLLGSVVMFGWSLALRATSGPVGQEEFDWWMDHATKGADQL